MDKLLYGIHDSIVELRESVGEEIPFLRPGPHQLEFRQALLALAAMGQHHSLILVGRRMGKTMIASAVSSWMALSKPLATTLLGVHSAHSIERPAGWIAEALSSHGLLKSDAVASHKGADIHLKNGSVIKVRAFRSMVERGEQYDGIVLDNVDGAHPADLSRATSFPQAKKILLTSYPTKKELAGVVADDSWIKVSLPDQGLMEPLGPQDFEKHEGGWWQRLLRSITS